MASLYPKKVGGRTYYYLREMARVDGKPKMVSERYLGSAEDIAAALEAREAASLPARTRHMAFGDVAAVWAVLQRLELAAIVDDVVGTRRADAGISVGTYLALATLNRVVAPCSKAGFADWWATTSADRFTKIPARVLDHRRFWDAMAAVSPDDLVEIERRVSLRMIDVFGLDTSAVALDMTNFATYIDSTNTKADIAQRGKAKQKRSDLRLVGLGLVVTRDGGVPLLSHTYPGNKPDVTQFPTMLTELATRHTTLTQAATGETRSDMTVVFDAGQNSIDNFALLDDSGLHFVGSIPPSDCPDLLALPTTERTPVDPNRFPGLTTIDTRRTVYGQQRRVILTHSPTLHEGQSRGLDQTLAHAEAKLAELANTLARGKTRRTRTAIETAIATITNNPWVKRILTTTLTGDTPAQHRLTWHLDQTARTTLEDNVFGKRILLTDRETWTVSDVVASYRSQSDAEFGFRQLKDPHVVSFSPMHHWTDDHIRVHTQTCVFALMTAHLMRRQAEQAGQHLSVRDLLDHLAGIQETIMIYPSEGRGRPKARRILTDTTPTQDRLTKIFDLHRWAPRT
jgi:transposase